MSRQKFAFKSEQELIETNLLTTNFVLEQLLGYLLALEQHVTAVLHTFVEPPLQSYHIVMQM